MKVIKIVAIVLTALGAVLIAIFFLTGYFVGKPGGIYVATNPESNVYINGDFVGKTPYTHTFKAGEIVLKLVPESGGKNLAEYETKITLVPGIQTVVRREFGGTEDISSGDIISFNKISGLETGILVISTPENAEVTVDGLPQGFAPYKDMNISPAEHQIVVKAPGYADRTLSVNTRVGYELSLFAKLAKTIDQKPVPTPTPQVETLIQILDTPTGFLRVRTEPGTAGEEIAEVKNGEKYQFLDEDVATGWVEIQYEAVAAGLPNGITGWVSGQYTKKITQDSDATQSGSIN